jgi:hypothetical protein
VKTNLDQYLPSPVDTPVHHQRVRIESKIIPSIWKGLIVTSLLFELTACSSITYDAAVDKQITDLSTKTETFVAKCDAERTKYAQAKDFYPEATGLIKSIQLRSSLYANNEKESSELDRLKGKYVGLEESHKEGPITSSLAEPVRVSLRSLTQMQIAKKRSFEFGESLKK